MNKRLWELYWQAKVPHTAIDPSNNMPYETTIFSADKFAELIVQECIHTVEHHGGMCGATSGQRLRDKFGVE